MFGGRVAVLYKKRRRYTAEFVSSFFPLQVLSHQSQASSPSIVFCVSICTFVAVKQENCLVKSFRIILKPQHLATLSASVFVRVY